MAKRLTGTDKWGKEWFQALTLKQKCLWQYLCDNCDLAGFWEQNLSQVSFQIGVKISEADLSGLKDVSLISPGLWLITDFCDFQYDRKPKDLDPSNRVHVAALKVFARRGVSPESLNINGDTLSDLSDRVYPILFACSSASRRRMV